MTKITQNDVHHPVLREVTETSLDFLKKCQEETVDIDYARQGSRFANNIVAAVGLDLRMRITNPKVPTVRGKR